MKRNRYNKKLFHEKKEIYKPRERKNKAPEDGNFDVTRKEYELWTGKSYDGSGVSLTVEMMEKALRDAIVFGEAEIYVDKPESSVTIEEEKEIFNSVAEEWGFE